MAMDHTCGMHQALGVGVGSMNIITDWWFGTCFIFPKSWDDDPICELIFFRGQVNHQLVII
jgi:hypothetical protein